MLEYLWIVVTSNGIQGKRAETYQILLSIISRQRTVVGGGVINDLEFFVILVLLHSMTSNLKEIESLFAWKYDLPIKNHDWKIFGMPDIGSSLRFIK